MATVELEQSVDLSKMTADLIAKSKNVLKEKNSVLNKSVDEVVDHLETLTGSTKSELESNKKQVKMTSSILSLLREGQKMASKIFTRDKGKSAASKEKPAIRQKKLKDCVCISEFSPKARRQLADAFCSCLQKAAGGAGAGGGKGIAGLFGGGKGGGGKGLASLLSGGGGGGRNISGGLGLVTAGAASMALLGGALTLIAKAAEWFVSTLIQAVVQTNNLKMMFASTQGELVDVSSATDVLQSRMREHERTGIMNHMEAIALREKIYARGLLIEHASEAAELKNATTRDAMFKLQLKRVNQLHQNIANASYMVGASIEKSGQMFETWRLQFQMSSVQLSVMSSHMISLAKNSGLMGDNLLDAVKSADKVIEKIQKMGGLTAKQARNIQDIMVAASKYGVGETTAKQLTAMTSLENFNKASAQERSFIFNILEHMSKSTGQSMDDLMQKLSAGTLTDMQNFQSEYTKAKKGAASDIINQVMNPEDWKAIGLKQENFDATNLAELLRHLTQLSSEGNKTATDLKNRMTRWAKEGKGINLGELAAELKSGTEVMSSKDRLKNLNTSLQEANASGNTDLANKINKEIGAVTMRDEFAKLADVQQKAGDFQALKKEDPTEILKTMNLDAMFGSMEKFNKTAFEKATKGLNVEGSAFKSIDALKEGLQSKDKMTRDMAFEAFNGMRMEMEKDNKVEKSGEQKIIDGLGLIVNSITSLVVSFAKWFSDGKWMTDMADWVKTLAQKLANWSDNPIGMMAGFDTLLELGNEKEGLAKFQAENKIPLDQIPETSAAFKALGDNINKQNEIERKLDYTGQSKYEAPGWTGEVGGALVKSTLGLRDWLGGTITGERSEDLAAIEALKQERIALKQKLQESYAKEAKAAAEKKEVPQLASGGLINQDGIASLHAGEIVLPPEFGIATAQHGLQNALMSLVGDKASASMFSSGAFEPGIAQEAMGISPLSAMIGLGGDGTLDRIADSVDTIANILQNVTSSIPMSEAGYSPSGIFENFIAGSETLIGNILHRAMNDSEQAIKDTAKVMGIATGVFDRESADEASTMSSISNWISSAMGFGPSKDELLNNAYSSMNGTNVNRGNVSSNSMDYGDQTKSATTAHSSDSILQKLEMAKTLPQLMAHMSSGGGQLTSSEYQSILKVMAEHLSNIAKNTESRQQSFVIGANGSQSPAPYTATIKNISNDPIRGRWDWLPDSEAAVGGVPHTGRGGQGI